MLQAVVGHSSVPALPAPKGGEEFFTYSPSVATLDRCSRRQARSACTSARAVSSEARHGMRPWTDARRISYPSPRGTPAPLLAASAQAQTLLPTTPPSPD